MGSKVGVIIVTPPYGSQIILMHGTKFTLTQTLYQPIIAFIVQYSSLCMVRSLALLFSLFITLFWFCIDP